jgi:hypothetical protein
MTDAGPHLRARGGVLHRMRSRFLLTLALATLAGLGAVAPASAAIVELGQSAQPPAPSCPADPCFAAARTTGYQAKAGDQRGIYVVPQAGRIVAWSITLSDPGARRTAGFEKQFGGVASAGISVLRPGRRQYARVVKSSPVRRLQPYFGQTVQFPLERSLGVEKGWIVALTVPTWAPSLAVGFGNDHSWRAASRRNGDCKDLETQSPQAVGNIARFRCLFRTARLTYTATLITEPAR